MDVGKLGGCCKSHFNKFSDVKWCPYFTIFVVCIWDLPGRSLSSISLAKTLRLLEAF